MKSPKYRWLVFGIFFVFMLLHQSDRLLIGPLTTPIMETFGIDEAQMGAVFTGALLVAVVFYPLWGYLYDRYARSKLLAAASFIWGSTTWLSAIAPTFPTFLATRASTGIDDSSYPGLYSLISDYFGPQMRGKIYGLLQLTTPLGYMAGMTLALLLRDAMGWRNIFYLTGGLGIVVSIAIWLGVREPPRGKGEPELAGLEQIGQYRFNWQTARELFRKRTLYLLFIQGFFGMFPWNVIAYWFFRYLETERGYSSEAVLVTMLVAVVLLALGYFVGGALGDFFFKRTPRGRLLVCAAGTFLGAIFLVAAINVPIENVWLFVALTGCTGLFIPFASPNVVSTVYDITPPEVRSTASAVQSFMEESGAALAPWITGIIAVGSSLQNAILTICLAAWAVCALFFMVAAYLVPRDIETLRAQMRQRAQAAQKL